MKKVIRCFPLWDWDEEQAWLNEMCAQGWLLETPGIFRYSFQSCQPNEYALSTHVIETNIEDRSVVQLIRFMQECGTSYIGFSAKTLYFCKKRMDGNLNMFSDLDQKITLMERRYKLLRWVIVCFAISLLFVFCSLLLEPTNIFNWLTLLVLLFSNSLFLFGFIKLRRKRKQLKKERLIHE